jgi:hypothetical protein
MKAVKIILAVVVIAVIGFITWKWLASVSPPPPITDSSQPKQFIEKIEKEIDSLRQIPDDRFCKEFYKEISYHIDDHFKNGKFGKTPSENEQWKGNFVKKLYFTYSAKFISQAFYVFKGSEWNIPDLRFIIDEYRILRNSELLEKDSPVDKKFTEIQQIINKYNEIASFVTDCRNFSYTSYRLSDRFPVSEMQNRISRAATYTRNGLENTYVNNCSRLKDELRSVPLILFNRHAEYLTAKIRHWSGKYTKCNSQSDYANNMYRPLRSDVSSLNNNIYNVATSIFDSHYERVQNLLNADSRNAYNYFNNLTTQTEN